jgi:RNA polymerase sigma factor (sigma-70 family)
MGLKERQAEIAEFFSRERQTLIRYLRGKVNDLSEMEIEDVIGDLMLNLFNRADISGRIDNLAGYIYRSLHNKMVDYLRKKKNTVSLNDLIESDGGKTLEDLLGGPDYDVAGEVAQLELEEKLFKALERLEPRQRMVWVATELEGYTFRELAEMWDQPIGTLLARKHRAAEVLQEALKEFNTKNET